MAQRESGYVRKERDAYMTPRWVTDVLIDDLEAARMLPRPPYATDDTLAIWEPAAGIGQMASALTNRGYDVICSDIAPGPGVGFQHDFTVREMPILMPAKAGGIITNPPYDQAEAFVANALDLMAAEGGLVAMLLKVDWDSAKTRRRFFADCPAFARKIVLLDRIHWFDPEPDKAGPSENHAWYVWDWTGSRTRQCAVISYATMPDTERARLRACRKAGASASARRGTPNTGSPSVGQDMAVAEAPTKKELIA